MKAPHQPPLARSIFTGRQDTLNPLGRGDPVKIIPLRNQIAELHLARNGPASVRQVPLEHGNDPCFTASHSQQSVG